MNAAKKTMGTSHHATDSIWLCIVILLLILVGCGEEQQSLHELDHIVPPHWPSSLQHASELIEARTQVAEQDAAARKELVDILSWVPEIAADTELGEQAWLSIFERCERLKGDVLESYSETVQVEMSELAKLLESTHRTLANLRPPGWSVADDDFDDALDSDVVAEAVDEGASQSLDEPATSEVDGTP